MPRSPSVTRSKRSSNVSRLWCRRSGTSTTVEQRGDVREAAARIETAVAKIDRAESEGRIDVSLFGNYMRMDAGFPQQGFAPDGTLARVRGQFNYWSAGAMLTIPIFNRSQGD